MDEKPNEFTSTTTLPHSTDGIPLSLAANSAQVGRIDNSVPTPIKKLSLLDKLLTPLVLASMVLGVILGEFVPSMRDALDAARFDTVSLRKSHYLLH